MSQTTLSDDQAAAGGQGQQQVVNPQQAHSSVDQTLNALFNNVTGGKNAEPSKLVSLLAMLRQQFSDPSRKSWPQETQARLWSGLVGALKLSQSPEVSLSEIYNTIGWASIDRCAGSCN